MNLPAPMSSPFWQPLRTKSATALHTVLYCFPHAGGSHTLYSSWAAALAERGIEVRPIQLPGRGRRINEAHFGSLVELAEALAPWICADSRPFALFGQSLGAIAAFEVSRHLSSRQRYPIALFASGAGAPAGFAEPTEVHLLSNADLAARLAELGGTPPDTLAHSELMELVLPAVRADFRMAAEYAYQPASPMPSAIITIRGIDDRLVSETRMAGWREETLAHYEAFVLPGGHFYLTGARDQVLEIVADTLAKVGRAVAFHGRQETRRNTGVLCGEVGFLRDVVRNSFDEVIGFPPDDLDESLFDLGGDSLSCIYAARKISAAIGRTLALRDLMRDPSVNGIVRTLLAEANVQDDAAQVAPPTLDDFRLPHDIQAAARARVMPHVTSQSRKKGVLVTGATGFLGCHLVSEILSTSPAVVYCLVRGAEPVVDRLRAKLKHYQLWHDRFEDRIILVSGDLDRARLGMSDANWHLLSDHVDEIFHCGASVNHVYPFEKLKAANVESCVELLKLCVAGRRKTLHFASSVAVFGASAYDNAEPDSEDWPLTYPPQASDAYSFSKAAAERVLWQARALGIPVVTHRIPTLTGHSVHAVCNEKDWLWATVRAMAELQGVIPSLVDAPRWGHLLVPVDVVARSMVLLSAQAAASGGCFHHFPLDHVELSEFPAAMRRAGFDLDSPDSPEWRRRVLQARVHPKNEAFLWIFDAEGRLSLPRRRPYSIGRIESLLPGHPIVRPDALLLQRYVQTLIDSGFLQHPTSRRMNSRVAV